MKERALLLYSQGYLSKNELDGNTERVGCMGITNAKGEMTKQIVALGLTGTLSLTLTRQSIVRRRDGKRAMRQGFPDTL